jgi:hypothetical protein
MAFHAAQTAVTKRRKRLIGLMRRSSSPGDERVSVCKTCMRNATHFGGAREFRCMVWRAVSKRCKGREPAVANLFARG